MQSDDREYKIHYLHIIKYCQFFYYLILQVQYRKYSGEENQYTH